MTTAHDLRTHLEERALTAFLADFERCDDRGNVELTTVTQRILPGVLLELFEAGRVSNDETLGLWKLVRSGRLLVVDNRIIEAINAQLHEAWVSVHGAAGPQPEKLLVLMSEDTLASRRARPMSEASAPATAMQRVVVTSSFCIGPVRLSDSTSFKRNLCFSAQEREFLKAVRQYFPSLWAYPNVPLRNFIDTEAVSARLSERHRSFAWSAQVDALLCTDDEDPVAAFELDSAHHDTEEAVERDQLKNDLLELAGVPLVRIRPSDTRNVRAEDFFDLLCAQQQDLDLLRPRRMRPRRTHDMLVPAEARFARFAA